MKKKSGRMKRHIKKTDCRKIWGIQWLIINSLHIVKSHVQKNK